MPTSTLGDAVACRVVSTAHLTSARLRSLPTGGECAEDGGVRMAAVVVVVMLGSVAVRPVVHADTLWNSAWVDSIATSPDSTAPLVSGPLTLGQALRLSARHHPTLTAGL